MKISVLDKIVICNSMLQNSGSITELEQSFKIQSRLNLTKEELEMFEFAEKDSKEISVSVKNVDAYLETIECNLDKEDIKYLQNRIKLLDESQNITMFMLHTVKKIRDYQDDNTTN